jgi:hypothetical protein
LHLKLVKNIDLISKFPPLSNLDSTRSRTHLCLQTNSTLKHVFFGLYKLLHFRNFSFGWQIFFVCTFWLFACSFRSTFRVKLLWERGALFAAHRVTQSTTTHDERLCNKKERLYIYVSQSSKICFIAQLFFRFSTRERRSWPHGMKRHLFAS